MAMVQITYPPLDVPKPVTENVWIVDSGPVQAFGLPFPLRMTVVRLADGALLLHAPTRCEPGLRLALERLGRITHLVAPNIAHWMFLKAWQRACPDAVTWAAPGLRERAAVRRAGVTVDRVLDAAVPAAWAADLDLVVVPGGLGFQEFALFHRASRTLILTDIVQNLEPHKLPVAARLFLRAMGAVGPTARPPLYLRALVRMGGAAAREAGGRLVALAPARVIFAHGRWFPEEGTARLRRSLGWLTGDA